MTRAWPLALEVAGEPSEVSVVFLDAARVHRPELALRLEGDVGVVIDLVACRQVGQQALRHEMIEQELGSAAERDDDPGTPLA